MKKILFIIILSISLASCSDRVIETDACTKEQESDLCFNGKTYNLELTTRKYYIYKSVDTQDTKFVKDFLFMENEDKYYYFTEDVDYDFIAFNKEKEMVNLEDLNIELLLSLEKFNLDYSNHEFCFINTERECYEGFLLEKEFGEYKMYRSPHYETIMQQYIIYEDDEMIIETSDYYKNRVKITYKGIEYTLEEAYLIFPIEVFTEFDIPLLRRDK